VGIWGGLWSLPEFADTQAALDWCAAKQLRIRQHQSGLMQRHTFSHFHLDYTPLWIYTDNPINFVMEAGQSLWYNAKQIDGLGLPAPIKTLLKQHFNHEDNHD